MASEQGVEYNAFWITLLKLKPCGEPSQRNRFIWDLSIGN